MKYLYIVLIVVITLCFASFAWSQAYVRAGGGYGLSLGGKLIGTDRTSAGTTTTYEGVYGSYGEGINFGAAIGGTISTNLKAELGFGYNTGGSFDIKRISSSTNTTETFEASFFGLYPSVIINTEINNLKPYARFGAVFGFPSGTRELTGSGEVDKDEASGGMGIGFTGGLGTFISLADNISFYSEISFMNMSWSPDEIKWTEGNETGTWNLKDSYTSNDANTGLFDPRPFGNIGINIGLVIEFK